MTADLQARRRLGLTATLVREDGREDDVFSLIGPKRYDAPWKDIEAQGWIAPADCVEVRVTLSSRSGWRTRRPSRGAVPARLVHAGQDLGGRAAGREARRRADAGDRAVPRPARRPRRAPRRAVIKGETTVSERERLFEAFRTGEINLLVVCKVANFSIDLPEAAVAIQVSGSLRLPAGGGAAARPAAAAEGGRPRPASTPSWRGTPSTRTSPRTASGSWPSRATPTGSWTRKTCSPDPGACPHPTRQPAPVSCADVLLGSGPPCTTGAVMRTHTGRDRRSAPPGILIAGVRRLQPGRCPAAANAVDRPPPTTANALRRSRVGGASPAPLQAYDYACVGRRPRHGRRRREPLPDAASATPRSAGLPDAPARPTASSRPATRRYADDANTRRATPGTSGTPSTTDDRRQGARLGHPGRARRPAAATTTSCLAFDFRFLLRRVPGVRRLRASTTPSSPS